jgi:hypothetical protein
MMTSMTVSFNDGSPELLNGPINMNGGAAFFGFVDPGAQISSVTISGVGSDAWGIDDVTYNPSAQLVLPEPTSLLLLGGGVVATPLRRRGD